MPEEKQRGGRPMPNIQDSICWDQRIARENAVNAKVAPQYSVRAVVQVEEVPGDFKPGHVDPVRENKLAGRGFVPEDYGFDPHGEHARDFRRFMTGKSAGPRDRQAFPETAQQELGWLLSPDVGDHKTRMRRNKNRMGIGWPEEPGKAFSEVSAELFPASMLSVAAPPPTKVSAVAPCTSDVSAVAPSQVGTNLSAAAPSRLSACSASASALSATRPLGGPPGSTTRPKMAPSTSLPAIPSPTALEAAAAKAKRVDGPSKLRSREEKVAKALAEQMEFHCKGVRGNRHDHPLGMTDATAFDDAFTLCAGMPLYKAAKKEDVVLLHPKFGTACPKWR